MSYLSPCSHSKSNVSSSQSRSIICSISCDGNDISKLLKTNDHEVFIVRSRSSEYFKFVPDNLHVFEITNLFFVTFLAHYLDSLFCIFVNQRLDKIIKCWSFHTDIWLLFLPILDDIAFLGNSNCCLQLVSCYHSYSDSSQIASRHSFWYFWSNNILYSSNTYQSVVRLFNLEDLTPLLDFVVLNTSFVNSNVFISESNISQCEI
jgi:hypothetical protein